VAGLGCLIDRPPITGGNMTRMALPTPRLHTARLRLRPFGDADANDLFALHSSACVLRDWDAPPWSERVRAERFITACRQMAQEGTGARLAVDRQSRDALISARSDVSRSSSRARRRLGQMPEASACPHGSKCVISYSRSLPEIHFSTNLL
jgi:hypothetical protein